MLRPPWQRRNKAAPAKESAGPDWRARFARLAQQSGHDPLRRFYGQLPVAADTPIAAVPLLALDIETTGLDAAVDSIVSIGLVPCDHRRIRCRGARHWLVKPQRALVESSIQYHGITHTALTAAPALGTLFGDLLEAMAGRVIVVHCHEIERQFLAAAARRLFGEGLEFPVIDTMVLEARVHRPHPMRGLVHRLLGTGVSPPVSLRLDAVRRRYGLPSYRPHHALTDALATAELLQAQLQHHYTPQTPLSALWA